MAIKVTGLFQNPTSGLIYQNPLLKLIPHLEYPGKINMDVIIDAKGIGGAVGYININKNSLTYPTSSIDSYNDLIYALETYIISNLQNANEINSSAVFVRYSPPTGSI